MRIDILILVAIILVSFVTGVMVMKAPAQCPTPTTREPTGWCDGKNGTLDVAPGSIVDCFRGWV